jgi:hypothetical protein
MRQETGSLLAAISDEFNILTTARSPGEKLRSSRLNEAFAALQEKVNETRDQGILIGAPLQTAIAFAGHFAAIRSVCDELNNIRSATEGLPRFGQPLPEAKQHWDLFCDRLVLGEGRGKRRLSRGHFNRLPEMDQSAWSSFNSVYGVASHHFGPAVFASRWHRRFTSFSDCFSCLTGAYQ